MTGFTEMVAVTLVLGLLSTVITIGIAKRWGRTPGLAALAFSLLLVGAFGVTTWQRNDPAPRHISFQGSATETLLFIVPDPAGVTVDLSLPLLGTPALRLEVPVNGVVKVANYTELEPQLMSAAADFNGRKADAQLELLPDGQRSVLCFDFTQPEVPAGEHAARLKARE